jgi:hypothetical protein
MELFKNIEIKENEFEKGINEDFEERVGIYFSGIDKNKCKTLHCFYNEKTKELLIKDYQEIDEIRRFLNLIETAEIVSNKEELYFLTRRLENKLRSKYIDIYNVDTKKEKKEDKFNRLKKFQKMTLVMSKKSYDALGGANQITDSILFEDVSEIESLFSMVSYMPDKISQEYQRRQRNKVMNQLRIL